MRKLLLGLLLLFLATDLFAQSSVRRRPVFPVAGGPALLGATNSGLSVTDGTQISGSWTSTTTSNPSCIFVMLPFHSGSGTAAVSNAAWGAVTLSRVPGTNGTGPGDYAAEIWVGDLGATHTSAANTLTVNFSASVWAIAIIQQVDNCNRTTPTHDGIATNATTESGTASVTVANVVSTDIVFATFMKADGTNAYTITAGTELAQLQHPGLTSRRAIAFYRTGVTGSVNMQATFTSTFWGGAAAASQ